MTVLATGVLMTAVDPILVTELSVVFSAVALPLTYFPILVVANDPDYMGEHVNGRLANTLGTDLPRGHRRRRAGGDPADDLDQDGGLTEPGDNRLAGDALDAVLHLLDRQVVDLDGLMVCKVDDVELTEYADGVLGSPGCWPAPAALVPRSAAAASAGGCTTTGAGSAPPHADRDDP